jgi:hypothetical protein
VGSNTHANAAQMPTLGDKGCVFTKMGHVPLHMSRCMYRLCSVNTVDVVKWP